MFLKYTALILIFYTSFNVYALNSQFDLTHEDEDIILLQLNNICGDTWCEGEYELNFTSILFHEENKGFYQIQFQAEDKKISCDIKNVQTVQKVLWNLKNSASDETELEFYKMIDDCINEKLYSKK